MNMKTDRNLGWTALLIFCASSVAAFFILILSIKGLSPIDDHHFLINLFQGKHFDVYIDRKLGRFFPATAQEYALVSAAFGPSSWLFHLVEALKMTACGALLLYCLIRTGISAWVVAVTWSATFFSVAFADSSVRLLVGELNDLILTLILIAALMFHDQTAVPSRKHAVFVGIGVVALVTGFFYKEVIFTMALVLGVAELQRHRIRHGRTIPLHPYVLIAAGLAYLVWYMSWRGIDVRDSYIGIHQTGIRDVVRTFAQNDPVIVFVVLPATAIRLLMIIRQPQRQTLYDSFLLTASAYACVFVMLKMYASYYFLPAYGFGLCGLAGVLVGTSAKPVRAWVGAVVALLAANNATVALSDIQTVKQVANNYERFVSATTDWIASHPKEDGSPRNLVLAGSSFGSRIEIVISMQRFFRYVGLADSTWKVRVTEPTTNALVSAVYGFKDNAPYAPGVGDLVVYTPFQDVVSRPPLLSPSYQDVFRSGSDWASPRWTLWDWTTWCVEKGAACASHVSNASEYTGYDALLKIREPAKPDPASIINNPSYRVGPIALPQYMATGDSRQLAILIQNTGKQVWPIKVSPASNKIVDLGYVWIDQKGSVAMYGDRAAFPEPMQPGDVAKVSMTIKAPVAPGRYELVISPLQENVEWFYTNPLNRSSNSPEFDIF